MSKKSKKQIYLAVMAALLLSAMVAVSSWTMEGCAGKLPPISAVIATSTP